MSYVINFQQFNKVIVQHFIYRQNVALLILLCMSKNYFYLG